MSLESGLLYLQELRRELIPISGTSKAKQIPLAVATPILSPVYDPGPLLTETASISVIVRLAFFKTFWINPCKSLTMAIIFRIIFLQSQ